MKVLWATERFAPQRGGVAAAAARQVAALAPAVERLDVVCLTAGLPPGEVDAADHHGASVHWLGRAPRDEESLQLLHRLTLELARRYRHDLVHGFYAVHAGSVAVTSARELGVPSVVSVRGNDLDLGMFQGSRAPFLDRALRGADAVTVVSAEMVNRIRAVAGRTEAVHRIPNGVDGGTFSPGAPDAAHLALLGDAPRPWIGFFGELRFKKGLPVLLRLAADLGARGSGSLFAIGGARGADGDAIEAWRATEPASARRFHSIPYVRDVGMLVSLYRAMDLVVFPSLWDGLPNALLEAMACGRAVLATRVGGIPDVVEDGRSGFLLEVSVLDDFAETAARVLALDANRRDDIGRSARERVLRDFTIEAEARALLGLYGTLARAPG